MFLEFAQVVYPAQLSTWLLPYVKEKQSSGKTPYYIKEDVSYKAHFLVMVCLLGAGPFIP